MQTNNKQNKHLSDLSFNEQCYLLLKQIPKGRVTTYKAIAEALGTKAYQAVGNAMNKNPNPINVPCHRVVNTDGRLGGYAFGLEKKMALLTKEGLVVAEGRIVDFKNVFFNFQDLSD